MFNDSPLALAEKFESSWPMVPKFQVIEEGPLSYICFEFEGRYYYVAVLRVSKGDSLELHEEFIIYNPHKPITIDRLIAVFSGTTSDFIDFVELMLVHRRKGTPLGILIEKALLELIVQLLKRPAWFRNTVECACIQDKWSDLRAVPSWLR